MESGEEFGRRAGAERQAGVTLCMWNAADGFPYIAAIPGAAWYFERHDVLTGTPAKYPGVIASIDISQDSGPVLLKLVLDGS